MILPSGEWRRVRRRGTIVRCPPCPPSRCRRITLVAVAAFQHKLWTPKLERLRAVARVRLIICPIEPPLARARHIARGLADPERERFHDDLAVRAAREGRTLPLRPFDVPAMDVPTLVVDTSDGYRPGFDRIVAFARAADDEAEKTGVTDGPFA